jgi:uncharacterized membrane protein YphA (DoxX/SURF4 family)
MTGEDWISRNAPKWYIAVLRLFMGYYFLYVGVRRVLDLMGDRESLAKRYAALAAAPQFPWFKHYLDIVIAPVQGAHLLSPLLTVAPLLLGLSLVLGLFTRTSTLLGVLLVLNIYLLKFHDLAEGQGLFYQMQLVSLLVLLFAGAGRVFGVDALFWRNRMREKYGETSRRYDPVVRGESRASKTPQSIPLSGEGTKRGDVGGARFGSQPGGQTPEKK